MSRQIEGTRAEAEAIIAAIDADAGYPIRGRKEGRGPHQEIADTYSPGAPGWEETWAKPEQDPADPTRYAVPVDDEKAALLRGRTIGGRRIEDADIVERDRSKWDPEPAPVVAEAPIKAGR